jgi:1,2-diacylglycerol 3-beta-glucosyltransferase
VSTVLECAWIVTGGWSAASVAYLLTILASAAKAEKTRELSGVPPELNLLVLVPAHNEGLIIGQAVKALIDTDYPADQRTIVVIADNCTDNTVTAALDAGALVWERDDPLHRGKGAALAWGIERGFEELLHVDAVLVVDADCQASDNLLTVIAAKLDQGAPAVQVDYVAANPEDSPAAALRYVAFLLMNTVRPRGKVGLGLSCGLLGTGMAFTETTLRELPWTAYSVTEDREYHLRLVERGLRVAFAPEARVTTPVPVTWSQGSAQQLRWDSGNVLLARRWVWKLASVGLRRQDVHLVHAAGELLVPPQTTLSSLTVAGFLLASGRRNRPLRTVTMFAAGAQLLYVFAGVRLVGSPRVLWRVLPAVPQLVFTRVRQQLRILAGRGSQTWVRTERAS